MRIRKQAIRIVVIAQRERKDFFDWKETPEERSCLDTLRVNA
jgi:hypothetical protein